jgi:BirA family transcriptional regulator, biotin operon repressor / biotin---[acetyl-CoA-carboxylase] ligase
VNAPAPTPLHWAAESLWQALQPVLPGAHVEVAAQLDSTNTQLLARARRPDADLAPCLLVAEAQTAGRGRLGRGWASTPGRSLTFSLGLPLAPAHWGGLSLAVGVALAEALEPAPGAEPQLLLKWPNDLWLRDARAPAGGRKLGGVLIETVAVGARRVAVIGVGLNVLPGAADSPGGEAPLAHGAASLHELDAAASAPAALAAVALPLARAVARFEREGLAPFRAGYAARDLLRGRAVTLSGGESLEGVADGIDEQGALRVQAGGLCRLVSSGEASVRLAT